MKQYFRLLFFATIILLHNRVPVIARSGTIIRPTDSVSAFLTGKMKKLGIPGLQFAIIQHGKIINSRSYGLANVEYAVPVTNKTVFSIASATKPFTAIAVMQLMDDGLVELSAPVSKYLDSLPVAWQRVTIKQLLTHISGIPNIVNPATSLTIVDGADNAWAKVQTLPMEFNPGERFSYNQTNYLLLGRIIDKLSGKSFSRFITERQFNVAGMPLTIQSGFVDVYDIVQRNATLYMHDEGKLKHNFQYAIPYFLRTGSGICSNATELAHWIVALEKGKLFKSANTLNMMWTPGTLNNGQPSPWALGRPVKARHEHFAVGGFGGTGSAFFVYPEDDLAIVILTNLAGSNPETFIDEVAGYYIPDLSASNGFGLPADIKVFRSKLLKRGFEHAIEVVEEEKKNDPGYRLPENELNAWGYKLIEQDKKNEALEIFKLNIYLYPQSWNVYDSYGEALEGCEKKDDAIKMFKQSLKLNPGNANAAEHLKHLE